MFPPQMPSEPEPVQETNPMGDGHTLTDRGAVIKVLGVGGGGSNAVNRMYKERVPGVEYVVINTDTQHLSRSDVPTKIAIGQRLTRGLGVGGNPELGRQAAEESREELAEVVKGADMVFITAGMGGGTGTGAAPTIAELAKEGGALTVAVVSKPFVWEVYQRRKNAEDGITRLKDKVDTLIGIPNDRLLSLSQQREELYTWEDALKLADTVLQQGVQTIAEVVTVPGEINVDFADVKAVMSEAGPAWMALGKGRGEHRAIEAARQATKSPLLDISIEGARRILFVLTGGTTLTLKEVQEAADAIQEVADPEANVIFGTVKDLKMDDEVKITLIATGFPSQEMLMQQEEGLRRLLRETASNGDEDDLEVPTFLRREAARMRRARPGFVQ